MGFQRRCYGGATTLYVLRPNDARGACAFGYDDVTTIETTGAPLRADPRSIAMPHVGTQGRLYHETR